MCLFEKNDQNNKQRWNPPNREAALCYQLYDFLVLAYGKAQMGRPGEVLAGQMADLFAVDLKMIEDQIRLYRQKG